ncbi:hypothetical protein ACQ86N_43865 [Puia sp. P3]|uniref:hypothetical protein n=1 Tax=Puia sp. P3 TaxID=3423952 RepID=UPI003D6699DD
MIVWSVLAGPVFGRNPQPVTGPVSGSNPRPGAGFGGNSGPGADPAVAGSFRRLRWLPLALILAQVTLGVSSLLTSPGIVPQHWGLFDWLAQLHQIVGLLFLLTMVRMLYLVIPVQQHPVTV